MLNSETAFWLIVARQLKIMTEHATYFEKADHSTFQWFEKQQIIIAASEMEKVIICINDFLFNLSGLVSH